MAPVSNQATSEDVVPLGGAAWRYVLAVAVLLALALAWPLSQGALWFEPSRLAPLQSYLLGPRDASPMALAQARSSARHQADVLILGSSAVRESLLPPEQLGALAGGIAITDLTSSGQNPLESLFLLSQAPLRKGQRVLLFVGPSLLAQSDFTARLSNGDFLVDPLSFADSLPNTVAKPANWTEPLPRALLRAEGSRKLSLRLLRWAWPASLQQQLYGSPYFTAERYYYDNADPARQVVRQAEHAKRLSTALGLYGNKHLRELPGLLQQIAAYCRAAGARLTVLEPPHPSGDITTLYGPWWMNYLEIQRQSALTQGYRFVDLNPRLRLGNADFTDKLHLAAGGRQRWSKAFADWLRKTQDGGPEA